MIRFLGQCRELQDRNEFTWGDLALMKTGATAITREEWEKTVGPLDEEMEKWILADPTFGFYVSTLRECPVYYLQYAGFEDIWECKAG